MKSIISVISIICVFSITSRCQVPQGIPYQAVVRDNGGNPLVNTPLIIRFSLHDITTDGAVVYQENHSTTSNTQGLVSLNFGGGSALVGTFSSVNWAVGNKFLQVESNIGSGFVDLGTQQLMSVPYALFSGTATQVQPTQELQIGQEYQGGTIFYLDKTGQHGFVMADTTIFCFNCHLPWNTTYGPVPFAETPTGLYSGRVNTSLLSNILAMGGVNNPYVPSFSSIPDSQNIFRIVENLAFNGFDDWFVPSYAELLAAYAVLNGATTLFNNEIGASHLGSSSFVNDIPADVYNPVNEIRESRNYGIDFLNSIGDDVTIGSLYPINYYSLQSWQLKIVREF